MVSSSFDAFKKGPLGRQFDEDGVSAGWGLEADFPAQSTTTEEKGSLFFACFGAVNIDQPLLERLQNEVALLVQREGSIGCRYLRLRCKTLDVISK